MRKLLTALSVFFIATTCNGQPVQLAPPLLKYTSVFFKEAATVELQFAQQGTQIHYTLDNQQPTVRDKIYAKPIQLKKSITTLKAITSGDGFLPSAMVSATFIKDGFKIKSIQQTPANERFPGNGVNALIDNEGGLTDLNAKTWLGYQSDSVEINIQLDGKQELSSALIHCLQDHGSWVFLPAQISVYYFDDKQQSSQLIAEQFHPAKEVIPGAFCQPIIIALSKKVIAEKIKIVLRGVPSLPEDHPGKGKPAWLFIDEIKLY